MQVFLSVSLGILIILALLFYYGLDINTLKSFSFQLISLISTTNPILMSGDAIDTGVMYTFGDSSNNSEGVDNYPDKATQVQGQNKGEGQDSDEERAYSGKTGDILNLVVKYMESSKQSDYRRDTLSGVNKRIADGGKILRLLRSEMLEQYGPGGKNERVFSAIDAYFKKDEVLSKVGQAVDPQMEPSSKGQALDPQMESSSKRQAVDPQMESSSKRQALDPQMESSKEGQAGKPKVLPTMDDIRKRMGKFR